MAPGAAIAPGGKVDGERRQDTRHAAEWRIRNERRCVLEAAPKHERALRTVVARRQRVEYKNSTDALWNLLCYTLTQPEDDTTTACGVS